MTDSDDNITPDATATLTVPPRSDAAQFVATDEPSMVLPSDAVAPALGDEGEIAAGTVIADRYRVVEWIGSGGMGSVYRAEHVLMKKQVALKVLHREMTALPEAVQRFEREAIAAGRIDHVNVAKATDFGQLEDGSFYLVLEYVDGESLADILRREPLSTSRALDIGRQIAEAMGAAHDAEIVHRDLKPENVLIVGRGSGHDTVKVLDFGIAKVGLGERGGAPITQVGSVFGTPEYMAPEQAAGKAVDARADLYALGLLLYRMLAGKVPFSAEETSRVLTMQITATAPELPARISAPVRDLVRQLLEKEPERRPSSAREVAVRLLGAERAERASTTVLRAPRAPAASDAAWKRAQTRVRLPIFGWELAAWQLGAVALVLVLACVWGVSGSSNPSGSNEPKHSAAASPEAKPTGDSRALDDPELQKLISGALRGDPEALLGLERRPANARGISEWLGLATGHAKQKDGVGALVAYEEALHLEPAVAEDPKFWRFMWGAVQKDETAERALRLASTRGGARGADLLYAAWVELTKEETPATRLAKELVYTKAVRERASTALAFALDLREATTCERYRELLDRAAAHGDLRSARILTRIRFKTACDLPPAALDAALAAVKERAAPAF